MALEKIAFPMIGSTTSSDFNSEEFEKEKVKWLNDEVGSLRGYDCNVCKNKGFIYFWEDGRRITKDCKCKTTRRCISEMKKSGLEKSISDYTFDSYIAAQDWQKAIKDAAVKYSNSYSGNWFLIAGQSGCGKTHICTAICRKLLLDGVAVRYIPWVDTVNKLKAATMDGEKRGELINEIKKAAFLYVDDLYKLSSSEADKRIAFEIFNYRIINKLPTMISTEYSFSQLNDIDEAIAGRLTDQAGDYCLFIGKDIKKNYRYRNVHIL